MPDSRPFLLLLAGTFALTATRLSAASDVLLQSDRESLNCPVTLYAQPRFEGGVLLVPDQAASHDRAGVHLHLEDPDGRAVRSAEVTLRGVPSSHGAQPASFGNSSPLSRSFHVVAGADGSLTTTLWLDHAATIRNVSVTAIEYTAAPAWHASSSSSCIAIPNGNRLLGSLR